MPAFNIFPPAAVAASDRDDSYNINDATLKSVGPDSIEKGRRNATRKTVKKALEDRYNAGKNKWFFTKLRF